MFSESDVLENIFFPKNIQHVNNELEFCYFELQISFFPLQFLVLTIQAAKLCACCLKLSKSYQVKVTAHKGELQHSSKDSSPAVLRFVLFAPALTPPPP